MEETVDERLQPPQASSKARPASPPPAPLGAGTALFAPQAQAQTLTVQAREGRQAARAALEPLRAGRHDAYMANVKKFTETTGIEVRVDNEGWEDVRPKAAVAANTGAGPGHHPVDQRRRQPVSRTSCST